MLKTTQGTGDRGNNFLDNKSGMPERGSSHNDSEQEENLGNQENVNFPRDIKQIRERFDRKNITGASFDYVSADFNRHMSNKKEMMRQGEQRDLQQSPTADGKRKKLKIDEDIDDNITASLGTSKLPSIPNNRRS